MNRNLSVLGEITRNLPEPAEICLEPTERLTNRTKNNLNWFMYEPVENSNQLELREPVRWVEPEQVTDILSLDYEQLELGYGYPYPR